MLVIESNQDPAGWGLEEFRRAVENREAVCCRQGRWEVRSEEGLEAMYETGQLDAATDYAKELRAKLAAVTYVQDCETGHIAWPVDRECSCSRCIQADQERAVPLSGSGG